MAAIYPDLKDQTVIVTGAGQGLGRAYALAAAASGAALVINDIDPVTGRELLLSLHLFPVEGNIFLPHAFPKKAGSSLRKETGHVLPGCGARFDRGYCPRFHNLTCLSS